MRPPSTQHPSAQPPQPPQTQSLPASAPWLSFPKGICFLALALVSISLQPLRAQEFGSLDSPSPRSHQFITYAAEQQSVPAGKRAVLELRFQVEPGYHVNSHTPKSELLIPTRVELDPTPGVKLAPFDYPAGKEYAFAFDPNEKLDVYADSFVVRIPITSAAAGAYTLHGTLKYQACDKAACYPPKSLPISILFNAVPTSKPAS